MINNKGKNQSFGSTLNLARRGNTSFFEFDIKKWTKKTLIRLACCGLIFLVLFTLKLIDSSSTNRMVEAIHYRLNQEITLKGSYQQALKIKDAIVARGSRALAVLNLDTRFSRQLILPMDGTISVFFNETIPSSGKVSKGIIIEGEAGQSIVAADDGVIIEKVSNMNAGHSLIIKHKGDILTVYKNMAISNVEVNQKVNKGDVIGENNDRLLFEIWNKKEPIDPLELLDVNQSKL